jgi:ABC-type glutathione transport system ATPase component
VARIRRLDGDSGSVVVARDLSIDYPGRHGAGRFEAVQGIDLTIEAGELFGIVGESGAGKSSLARVLAGRAGRANEGPTISGGSLTVLGVPLRNIGERTRRLLTAGIGFLPQHAGRTLRADLTVAENVAEPIFERDRHYDQRDAGRRAAELLDAVQLPLGVMAKYPYELSNGQRQRVAIARSLILEPRIWIADEPTGGVDVTVKGPVLDTLLELQSDRVFTALIVSHDASVMRRLTDRIAVLHRGTIVGIGPVEQVLASPDHPYIRGLRQDYELRTGPIALPGDSQ